jgi:hypothetical protein
VPELPLDRLQRWMQAVVVHPGAIDEAVRGAGLDLAEVIRPSRTLTPAERVGIYHGMYPLRMEEALEFDYPGLAHFLGGDAFRRLVRDYVLAHPSRSYTLNRLGDHLPEYVAGAKVRRPAFCADLARLERAVTEAFDAPETAALTDDEIAGVPEEAWETAVLVPVAALRLLQAGYPVGAYLDSVNDEGGHDHPPTTRRPTFMAVFRRNYGVRRLDLARPSFELLTALAGGETLGRALPAVLRKHARTTEDDVFRWFRDWVAGGVFHAVRLA